MKTAVVTVVSDRHEHLRRHLQALRLGDRHPDDHVIVAMGDPCIDDIVAAAEPSAKTVWLDAKPPLPLATARNVGAETALARGADLLIFLDVDCLAHPHLVPTYATGYRESTLLCGPVTYLPPPPACGYPLDSLDTLRSPHPARPDPPPGVVEASDEYDLFWSLSFAVSAHTWTTVGGFCPEYTGYGAEDTDYAYLARSAGIRLGWVGGADAFHQFHPISDPPVEHLDDILRNAALFHRRWGRWPMTGWLTAFEARQLIRFDQASDKWIPLRTKTEPPEPPRGSASGERILRR
jgi:GT2 family glycosyltransferase